MTDYSTLLSGIFYPPLCSRAGRNYSYSEKLSILKARQCLLAASDWQIIIASFFFGIAEIIHRKMKVFLTFFTHLIDVTGFFLVINYSVSKCPEGLSTAKPLTFTALLPFSLSA